MLAIALAILVFMTIMRFAFFFHFQPLHASLPDYSKVFLLGLNFDLRIVCGIVLFPFLIGNLSLYFQNNRRLTIGSILKVFFTLLIMVLLIIFMKKGHVFTGTLTFIGFVFVLILLWLFTKRNCNPFENRLSEKIFKWWFYIISFVLVLFYALDFQHYDYLHQRLSASIINYAGDAKISMSMIWETYPVFSLLLLIAGCTALLVWVVNFSFKKTNNRKYRGSAAAKFVTGTIFTLFLALGIFGRVNQYPLRWSDAFTFEDDFKANLALNPVQSFFSTLTFRNSSYDIELVKKYYPLMSEYLNVKTPGDLNFQRIHTAEPGEPKRNVVIVICESFSAYKSTMYGNPLNTTPYFNSLSENGVFFDRCFTPSYGTARGVWATITGIPDVEYPNTSSRNPSYVDQHSIMNDYEGYEKYYFIGGSSSWANIRGLLTNNLSNIHLLEEENFKAKKVDVWGISDKRLLLEANHVFSQQKKPFVAIIQTADNHRPYTIPEEDKKEFELVSFPEDTLKKYGFSGNDELNAFRYTDFAFKKFMVAAQKENYFDNTIFVFVGDHGVRGDASAEFSHAWETAGLTIHHVPLLFYAPKLLPGKRIHDACSQVDVLPTVSSIAGVSFTNTTMGRNLFDSAVSSLPFPHTAFIFDPTINQVGMVTNNEVYTKSLISKKEEITSLDSINNSESLQKTEPQLRELTDAWYQTAKYLLHNNRKEATNKK